MVEYRSFRLLAALPRSFGSAMRPHIDHTVAAMIGEVRNTVPAYGQPLRGIFGKVLVQSVEYAVQHCVDSVGTPEQPHGHWVEFYRRRGRIEFLEGRNLDALQDSATIGARVAWRSMHPAVVAAGVDPGIVSTAAEGIFAYVDELCATAIEGYQSAQSDAEGTVPVRRRRLLELITSAPEGAASSIAELAGGAGWTLPETAALVALERGEDAADFPAELLGDGVLAHLEAPEPHLLTRDPDADLPPLADRLAGWRAAVSPVVPLADAPAALRTARRALRLSTAEVPGPIIWCRDHLAVLWLLAEDFLAAELARRSLDPFASLGEKQRERLSETLLVWLESRGSAPEIAQQLGVHPHTVRNRLRQLEKLFGDRLRDADDRLGIQLALRAQRLMQAQRTPDDR
ncbi:PucR family transcriptional regulator [Amycolatopsis jiangsuensis]|uniref:DNA-binding CsgD family transcriptional regulator n=1 Tax=Amycolatopsis jiangsuensis TaxID=1181879 RepID=A0A840J517_9PSEU|nr:PucR family transcriptional regulator [Amycolatopsis jiangsuensis]MBB4688715.1 DNA-binding CsgD family transcriptional regulator [Amycolatopsis jiangsuensis]